MRPLTPLLRLPLQLQPLPTHPMHRGLCHALDHARMYVLMKERIK
jgi:hypothetical protein